MYNSGYKPKLKLQKTISHPIEDALVVGFEARDVTYGTDAVVLKGEEIPDEWTGNDLEEEVWAVPSKVIEMMENWHSLFVLTDEAVFAIEADSHDTAEPHTFEDYYGGVTWWVIPKASFTTYSRSEVNIG